MSLQPSCFKQEQRKSQSRTIKEGGLLIKQLLRIIPRSPHHMQNSSPKNHDETEGKMNQFLLVLKIRTRFADECYTLFIITLSLRSTVHKINAKKALLLLK